MTEKIYKYKRTIRQRSRLCTSSDWVCKKCLVPNHGVRKSCGNCYRKRITPVINLDSVEDEDDILMIGNHGISLDSEASGTDCDSNSGSKSIITGVASKRNGDSDCVICMEKCANTMLSHGDYGHTCVCFECAQRLKETSGKCPMCREKILSLIRNFGL